MQIFLHVGLREIGEEGGDALIGLVRLAAHHPEACAARHRVLRPVARLVIGQLADAVVHARFHDVAEPARAFGEDPAFARKEDLFGLGRAAAVFERAVLGEIGQRLEVVDEDRLVDLQLGIHIGEPVLVRGEGHVVPGREILGMDPGEPGRGVAAGGGAALLDLLRHVPDLGPGLGRGVCIEARLLEDVLVVIEDRRGRVVGEGQHRAVGLGIIGHDPRQVGRFVEAVAQHLGHRLDRALGRHHDAGAHVEDLDDVGGLTGAEGCDAGVQRLGVGALEDRCHLVVRLARVEIRGDLLDHFRIGARHGVPPADLGLGRGGTRLHDQRKRRGGEECATFHGLLSLLDGRMPCGIAGPYDGGATFC